MNVVSWSIEAEEQKLQLMRQVVVGGRRAGPHGVGPERHLLCLQHGRNVRVLARADVVVPDVRGGLCLVRFHLFDDEDFRMPFVFEGLAERVLLQFLTEAAANSFLLLGCEVLVPRKDDTVLPDGLPELLCRLVIELRQVQSFDRRTDGWRYRRDLEVLERSRCRRLFR
jgi:hypothetical protein